MSAPSALLRPSRPLSWLQAPLPPNLDTLVQDRATAAQLGKAFFWDMQVGSDGNQACASCHFVAGADARTVNTISPGQPQVATTFQVGGPETTLTPDDFPFHKLADPNDRNSAVLRDRSDVVGSQGVVARSFQDNGVDDAVDQCRGVADPIYNVHGMNVRQVTPRQAPSVINAAFYTRIFWDGRADTYFNGVNIKGVDDQTARVWKVVDGQPQLVQSIFASAGLASQATGPGLSEVEMACSGRTWQDVARKLFKLNPLAKQVVDPTDSFLGPIANSQSNPAAPGLNVGYADLIRKAFRPEFWNASDPVSVVSVRDITERTQADAAQRFLTEASTLLATSLDYETTLASIAQLTVPFLADGCIVQVITQDAEPHALAAVALVEPTGTRLSGALGDLPEQVLRSGRACLYSEGTPSGTDPELRLFGDNGFTAVMLVPLVARGRPLGVITFAAAESGRHYGQKDLSLAEELAHRCALAIENARLYRDAQSAIRLRDDFFSVASHELKTPVAALLAFTQFLLKRAERQRGLTSNQMGEALVEVHWQSDRIARLVAQLLDTSRVDAGKLALDPEPTDLVALVRAGVRTVHNDGGQHTITVMPQPKNGRRLTRSASSRW